MSRGTVIVGGAVAQRPGRGGHAWVFLQYLLGFRRLGWDVLFVDRLEPGMCVDASGDPAPFRESVNLSYLAGVMERFGLGDRWSCWYDGGRDIAGLPAGATVAHLSGSALLLNV